MSFETLLLLGAIAGFTIYLGLPLARVQSIKPTVRGFLSMFATGILLFLAVDVTKKMLEPVEGKLEGVSGDASNSGDGILLVVLVVLGLLVGLVGIVLLGKRLHKKPVEGDPNAHELSPTALSMVIAIGIGAHNLSEGLAIGQAAAAGSISLAWLLIIGFGLHNATEGFGIAGPLSGQKVRWRYLLLLGLIGGGPTFVGTVIGASFHSEPLFVFSLAFADGAIIYVIAELLKSSRRYSSLSIAWGLFAGFLAGMATDLMLTLGGV